MKHRTIHTALVAISACMLVLSIPARSQMNPIHFKEYDLPNGLHVILNEDRSAPVVSTVVHYRVGSRDENPHRTGFAHFFEHLMFEGTKDIPRASTSKFVQEAGGELNAHTSFDETVYYFEIPSTEVELALWIEYQRMRGLLVDSIGVETQRGVVKEERRVSYDNRPYGTWVERAFKVLFQGGSYGWTPIGSAQHIDSAAIREFMDFYNKFYEPNNATLVVAGDFDEQKVRDYISASFGTIPRGSDIKREEFKLPPLTQEHRETIYDKKAQLPAVYIGYRGPKLGEPDYYAAEMLNDILATGESSRLYQRLINNDQIAVGAQSFDYSLEYAGAIFIIAFGSTGKDIGVVEKTIYDELKKIQDKGVTDEEFNKTKNIKETEFIEGKKNVHEKAQTLARYYSYFKDANLINTEIEKFNKVTKEDIQRVAKKYFGTENRIVLTYFPGTPEQENSAPTGK